MRLFSKIIIATATVPVLAAGAHAAGTVSAPIVVTATVVDTCGIVTTDLAFGQYAGGALSGTASVTATCTTGTNYSVLINGGGSGNTQARRLVSGANTLTYQLYTDVARTNAWGDTTQNAPTGTGTGNGQVYTVYGLIPASQTSLPGNYSDTVTATISY